MDASSGKEEGALRDAPTPKLTELRQSNSGVAISQACKHGTTRVELMPQGHKHYARVICAVCGRFIHWSAKPANVERQKLNGFKLARLGMCNRLNPWERNFVHHVSQQRKLSPRQQVIVERLCADYLKREVAS